MINISKKEIKLGNFGEISAQEVLKHLNGCYLSVEELYVNIAGEDYNMGMSIVYVIQIIFSIVVCEISKDSMVITKVNINEYSDAYHSHIKDLCFELERNAIDVKPGSPTTGRWLNGNGSTCFARTIPH